MEVEVDEDSEFEVEEAEGFTDNEADPAVLILHFFWSRPGRYIGNSSRSQRRKRAENRNAALGSRRLETYFQVMN